MTYEVNPFGLVDEQVRELADMQQRVYSTLARLPVVSHTQEMMEYEYSSARANEAFVDDIAKRILPIYTNHKAPLTAPSGTFERLYTDHAIWSVFDTFPEAAAASSHIVWLKRTFEPLEITVVEKHPDLGDTSVRHVLNLKKVFNGFGHVIERDRLSYPGLVIGEKSDTDGSLLLLIAYPPISFNKLTLPDGIEAVRVNPHVWQKSKQRPQGLTQENLKNTYAPAIKKYAVGVGNELSLYIAENTYGSYYRMYDKEFTTKRKRSTERFGLATRDDERVNFTGKLTDEAMKEFAVIEHLVELAKVFGKADVFLAALKTHTGNLPKHPIAEGLRLSDYQQAVVLGDTVEGIDNQR